MTLSLLMLLAAFIPALVWLFLFLHEDIHPEPKHLVFYVFSVGALVTLPVLGSQILFQTVSGLLDNGNILFLVGLVVIEETFKFFAGYFAVHKNKEFDEPQDAMIYMIAIGLGFATVENLLTVATQVFPYNTASMISATETITLRFIGATLLHTLTGGILGYFWAKGIINKKVFEYVAGGLIAAIAVHGSFNFLIHMFQDTNVLYPTIFLVGVAFFVLQDFEKLKEIEDAGIGFK
ncbi:MAG: PrsW family glutamic-type intramembrane protease [Patescibacteria group bacterium]